uniref:Uncharacterized protein n=1 Tax=Romanomermis culicivorax TaxID=13658 RepID=A0A915IIQ2_ROMCU
MEHDIIKAKDISQVQEYHKTIWEYLKCLGISDVRRESLNAFLFGMLRTATDLETYVAYKPNGKKFSMEALLLKHGKSQYLLTVDATRENQPNLGSLHTFSNKKNRILHLNIPVSGGQLEISTSATSLQEAALIYDFEECGGFHIKNTLQQALENNNIEQVGHLKENLEQIQVTGQKHGVLIYIIAPTAEKNIAEIITDFGAFDETHSLSIAYDLEAKQIALFGLDPKTAKLDTENVESVCQRGSRRKRGSSSACSFLYNEEEDQMKIIDKIIKETIETKNPALKEHLSLIYELTGKIQMGFLARDFVGDLVQGDTKALVRDGFFFGGNLLAQKVGSMAAVYGAKVASKALSRSIVSFGLCLPKLAFDGYMAYQMVQQISNKDTVGAVTTGLIHNSTNGEYGLNVLAEMSGKDVKLKLQAMPNKAAGTATSLGK